VKLLSPEGGGEIAAIWFGNDYPQSTGENFRRWLAVDASLIPSVDLCGWLSVLTDENTFQGGRIEFSSKRPDSIGTALYTRDIAILPPIDAVFALGSPAVEEWLAKNNWPKQERYNSNFSDRALVDQYEAVEHRENPLYWNDAYATLGGWHMGWPEDDFHYLIESKLLVHTYRDSEPWVEAWQHRTGEFNVIRRTT